MQRFLYTFLAVSLWLLSIWQGLHSQADPHTLPRVLGGPEALSICFLHIIIIPVQHLYLCHFQYQLESRSLTHCPGLHLSSEPCDKFGREQVSSCYLQLA